MTTTAESHETAVADLPGGPYDVEFFFDPGCPFAWQTSVWIRRVSELRGIAVGWRFISLRFINEKNDLPEGMVRSQERTLSYLRICAAARERLGNDAVAKLYRTFGEHYWYRKDLTGDLFERLAEASQSVDFAELIASADLPADLIDAADDTSYDTLIRAESDEAFRRTGPDVGTPILTYDPPTGNSLFGPVISKVPDDETAVKFYDALRTFVDFPEFSELKRTKRADIDLPIFG
ncbi:mycothiol-dependent nitroreductase Rv2466c family protein [Millisia brevis]|uniref:mycothiol-dependent nitroreductase Rv2466c family protein n=1 Tax=Millisia brevis TaxID=264148 RepID=UPI0008353472|nr:hypothetical protein [Millisia brevis]